MLFIKTLFREQSKLYNTEKYINLFILIKMFDFDIIK